MFILWEAATPPNGGKWELMSYLQQVSSHLSLLRGVGVSNMIDIGCTQKFFSCFQYKIINVRNAAIIQKIVLQKKCPDEALLTPNCKKICPPLVLLFFLHQGVAFGLKHMYTCASSGQFFLSIPECLLAKHKNSSRLRYPPQYQSFEFLVYLGCFCSILCTVQDNSVCTIQKQYRLSA